MLRIRSCKVEPPLCSSCITILADNFYVAVFITVLLIIIIFDEIIVTKCTIKSFMDVVVVYLCVWHIHGVVKCHRQSYSS